MVKITEKKIKQERKSRIGTFFSKSAPRTEQKGHNILKAILLGLKGSIISKIIKSSSTDR
jgi:hypothetical protein